MLRVLFVTAPAIQAERLARKLLGERLIACANLIPGVKSLYWWQGKIDDSSETLLILKTPVRNVKALLKRIPALHPYSVPEILVLPVAAAHKPYAIWVEDEAKPKRSQK
ncbi:MAG: divalent-cation tolerance protein CutA [Planctomycetes bacterium]|nr:divalent-cation tolerance protein CutA [Planctomycetota bacterium]